MRPFMEDPAAVRPMLASTGDAPLDDPGLAYEPKYDGIRAIVSASGNDVRLWSRLGNEKTSQFPDIVAAVAEWSRTVGHPLVVDGEIVALDEHGTPVGFQNLQGRIHLKGIPRGASDVPGGRNQGRPTAAIVLFDVLLDEGEDLRARPLRERRQRLEALLKGRTNERLRLSEQVVGDAGLELQARAEALGWEGLVAKRLDSVYKSGRRSPDWRKLKLVRRQACVVGGWTEPRGSRPFFGALLLGIHDDQRRLQYVGHTGAGFTDAELGRVWKQLQALQTRECPFSVVPRTNERPHWVKPKLVAEVKFTEWTTDAKLRHPTYLGLRDDIAVSSVRKEPDTVASAARGSHVRPDKARSTAAAKSSLSRAATRKLLDQLDAIEAGSGNGVLQLPGGNRLEVSNLRKTFFPKLKLTKGDLVRHYVRVAPYILPVLAERPLVMKRYPNGVAAKPFYQHRAPDKLPGGVRVDTVEAGSERRAHLVGGSLLTLLYTVQLASISQDPWFSRVGTLDTVDHVAIDLDPPDDLAFRHVLDVACWVRDELARLKAPAFPKTSGAGGLHIYVPMPPGTPYEAGLLFAQLVATMVAKKHPKVATVERSIAARGRRIYVDYLQNIRGKTLASAYSARANEFAGVSTPLTWQEVEAGVKPQDFTIANFAERLAQVGDLWAGLAKSKGAPLREAAAI